ncbi:hypothetical protein [Nocardia sp. NPDC004750]
MPRQLDPDTRVVVIASEGEGDETADSTGDFVRHLPTSIADVWPRLLDLTF